MENTFYISEAQAQQIADSLDYYFTKDIKSKLKAIQKKYNIELTTDRQTNANILWEIYHKKALTECFYLDFTTNLTYPQLFASSNNIRNFFTNDLLKRFIKYNEILNAENELIWNFKIEDYIQDINNVLGQFRLYYNSESLNELLNCNDYKSFFAERYGINNASKKELKATEKALSFFDELLKDIPNKSNFFNVLESHFAGQELNKTHFQLFAK